ncbi:winged helix-turn-helix domain-containing protein, partial [Salmonella enterica subsp. enterica serovar Lubbock]|nr:winged helix-turn-helix domain-containing protein [Salmonella enterica subsp. enterica serovar Lubbock]
VDLAARLIHRGDEEIHLTPIEFRLLAVLLNNAGKVLTQRQLFIIGGKVIWATGFVMLVGQFLGARMGSRLVLSKGQKLIRPM